MAGVRGCDAVRYGWLGQTRGVLADHCRSPDAPWTRKLPKERKEAVRGFFKRSSVVVRQLDRRTAEVAQDIVWDHGIKPKDAVHVATAILAGAPFLDTFDDDLIGHSGTIAGQSLAIGRPNLPVAQRLDLGQCRRSPAITTPRPKNGMSASASTAWTPRRWGKRS